MNPITPLTLPFSAVLLHCLDERKLPIENECATGFIRKESDGLYLYTCWHVVTGYDPNNPKLTSTLPKRKYLRMIFQTASNGGVGECSSFDLALYDFSSTPHTPLWWQESYESKNISLNEINIKVPVKQDVVKIPLNDFHHPLFDFQYIDAEQSVKDLIMVGEKTYVVGYPHGYSVTGTNKPTAIVLTRFIASSEFMQLGGPTLLESMGAPGMSGSPVFVERNGEILHFGIYTGVIFPDQRSVSNYHTALGRVQNLMMSNSGLWALKKQNSDDIK